MRKAWLLAFVCFGWVCSGVQSAEQEKPAKPAGLADRLNPFKDKDLPAIFKKLDANKDDKLNKEEFGKLGEEIGGILKERPQLLDKVFQKLDSDTKGSITLEQFKKLKDGLGLAQAANIATGIGVLLLDPDAFFKKVADGKEKISKDDFTKKMGELAARLKENPQILERIFAGLDDNNDGSLTAEEVKKKLPDIREKLQGRIEKKEQK